MDALTKEFCVEKFEKFRADFLDRNPECRLDDANLSLAKACFCAGMNWEKLC